MVSSRHIPEPLVNHWSHNAKQWQHIGEPLRPASADIQKIVSWIPDLRQTDSTPFNMLLLGATPELAAISWPVSTRLWVIDACIDMIQELLGKKKLSISPNLSVGNWLQLPLPDSLIDLVVGDGCFSMLAADNYDNFTREILRVLKPSGYCCMRFFIRPAEQESIARIHADFLAGKVNNFHALKWRIAMALQRSLQEGVRLHDIWNIWNHYFKNQSDYFSWSEEIGNTIEIYKNNPTIYTFPSLMELKACLDNKFKSLDFYKPAYTLGERCPIFKLQSLDGALNEKY